MYREKNDNESIGIGLLARNEQIPRSRLSEKPSKAYGEAQTPAQLPSKASDLVVGHNMRERPSNLPRIQSSRSN